MDPQSQFGLASVKFLHGSQIVICNPQMEMPDASISICGSLREALWWSRLGSTSFLVLFCQLGKFLGARHLSAFFRALTDLHTTRLFFHSTRS